MKIEILDFLIPVLKMKQSSVNLCKDIYEALKNKPYKKLLKTLLQAQYVHNDRYMILVQNSIAVNYETLQYTMNTDILHSELQN
jgi:hypothetical protein